MPELPEVESVRRALAPVVGVPVVGVRVARRDVVRDEAGRRRGRLDPAGLLAGDRVEAAERKGKQLALVGASGRVVLVHLGMSGQVLLPAPGGRVSGGHAHVVWTLGDGRRLVFRDPRRFGGIWMLPDPDALAERWSRLGPDGLAVTGADLARALGGSRRAVKAALLDQAAVAGVGNIYADESLHAARIAPTRACASLGRADWDRLASCVRSVLRGAIRAGGSTLRDYRLPDGSAGEAARRHRVYARAGQSCPDCGGEIAGMLLAQRSTCWCPSCQH
ncbi:MAG: bifunctional DNA-formamidopyrimidine glycosylase/DNA-(apurinic or apyrimidinic site) lyase [Phycisphaerales bacterium]|nr:bifunctional DNA-formamidopyrimidine glycosylase/DNA-(apurinic or apyrimidinic site) lyase [Planctomycetota bacterium]MCH8508080.1 bifunctional DNA-formamidopyrimidine glycosylase/DNA-(apurinic or apyrimidinic site) lyase [Phycisphaerales bacterium]